MICSLALASHMEMCRKQKYRERGSKLAKVPVRFSVIQRPATVRDFEVAKSNSNSGIWVPGKIVHFTPEQEQNFQTNKIQKRLVLPHSRSPALSP